MDNISYKTKYQDTEIQDFIEYFLISAHVNMDIEDEAIFDTDELYTRYRFILDDLIQAGVYKGLRYQSCQKPNQFLEKQNVKG